MTSHIVFVKQSYQQNSQISSDETVNLAGTLIAPRQPKPKFGEHAMNLETGNVSVPIDGIPVLRYFYIPDLIFRHEFFHTGICLLAPLRPC